MNTDGKLQLFYHFKKIAGYRSLPQLIRAIQQPHFKKEIRHIRKLVEQGKQDTAQEAKKRLPAFTVSGIFSPTRKQEHLKCYTQYLVLDFDHLRSDQLRLLQTKTSKDRYSIAGFTSPGGQGYKIFIRLDNPADQHHIVFQQAADWYLKEYGLAPDPSGKDITRLCFMSYDPQAWINVTNKEIFPIQPVSPTSNVEETTSLSEVLQGTHRQSIYKNGNRNNFLYLFANNANRAGHTLSQTLPFAQREFADLPIDEITRTLRSAYQHHPYQYNTTPTTVVEDRGKAPSPPLNIDIASLPDLLKKGCQVFPDPRERDVFLTTALAILSAGLTGIRGQYDHRTTYPNLFTFVLAPAANGKSALQFARQLGDQLHQYQLEKSHLALKEYKRKWAACKSALEQTKSETHLPDCPEKPARRTWFIPANTSSAMLIKHLRDNKGTGMICESEADTLGNILKQDWGTYSDLLRKAFHFEAISYSRKGSDEFFEIDQPRLSVALSGTFNQIFSLIPSAEDGLFSRFLFYQFEDTSVWRDVSPRSDLPNLTDYFKPLSNTTFQLSQFTLAHPCHFQLRPEQWHRLNQRFSQLLSEANTFLKVESGSIIKRHGLILFRIAMILTACRRFERQDKAPLIVCTNTDFNLAFALIETYLQHSLALLQQLPQRPNRFEKAIPNHKQLFYQKLPDRFQRKEAISMGAQFNMKPRTIDRFLSTLLQSNYLTQRNYGFYEKTSRNNK